MKKLLHLLLLLVTIHAVSSFAEAADLTIYLYGDEGRPLESGDALIMVESPSREQRGAKWTIYIGLATHFPYYTKTLPDEEILNITIYTNQNTRRRDIIGLYGKKNHELHVSTKAEYMVECSSRVTQFGMPSEFVYLLEQLDRAFPDGVPEHLTNARAFLQDTVLRAIDKLPDLDDPELAKDKNEFRQRVVRHLQSK